MHSYLGAFLPAEEGGYVILFKDVPEVTSEGDSIAECVEMGYDALTQVLANYAKQGKALPEASDLDAVRAFADEEMKDEGFDHSRQPFFQCFLVPEPDTRTVRLSISMRQCDVDIIDQKARRMGMNRSEYIVYASQACPERPGATA